MLGTEVVTDCSHDESPHYPVVSILRVFLYSFFDFLNSLSHFTFFEKCEGPMSMTVMILWVAHLRTATHVYCLLVELVHVVHKGQVVVGKGMQRIQVCTFL